MKILLRRDGALGDVLLTTPVVRRLHEEHPDAQITVATRFAAPYENHPYVMAVDTAEGDYDQVEDLDQIYELQPRHHIVDAYFLHVFGDTDGDKRPELFFDATPLFEPDPTRPHVAVHAARAGWRNRTLPSRTWLKICQGLKEAGCQPILVGSFLDALPDAGVPFFQSSGSLAPVARLINSCAAFVGSDSALVHVAGATDTPIVGIYTSVNPLYRQPYRDRVTTVVPELACRFCHERIPAPTTVEHCERIPSEQNLCVQAVKSEVVVEAVLAACKKN